MSTKSPTTAATGAMHHPDLRDSRQAMLRARRMFHRTLSQWASDLLLLNRAGLRHPTWQIPASDAPAWSRAA